MSGGAALSEFMDWIVSRNPGETEFHQAVHEVARSVIPFVHEYPVYAKIRVLERMAEPDRVISFRVVWADDDNELHVNRGYRVQFNNSIGPYKGGIRFHPSVNQSVLKFLGFEQIFKNSLTGLPMGGGKGGADFDPKGRSQHEIMKFCQSFMTELYRHIGATVDVPAGDIGVGAREIGYMFGQYKRLTNAFEGVLTGKGLEFGGSLLRPEATGYGAVYFLEEMLGHRGDAIDGKRAAVSGSGNVACHAAEAILRHGGRPVTLSDSSGFVHDPAGITQEKLDWVKERKKQRATASRPMPMNFPARGFIPMPGRGACPARWRFRAPPRTSCWPTTPGNCSGTAASRSARARTCPARRRRSTPSRKRGSVSLRARRPTRAALPCRASR